METSTEQLEWPKLTSSVEGGIKRGELVVIGSGHRRQIPHITLSELGQALDHLEGGDELMTLANTLIKGGMMTEEKFLEIFREELEKL